jgi:bifunctional non-homologous end joining protein LigD
MAEKKSQRKPHNIVDLKKYRDKRDFAKTNEPRGGEVQASPLPIFVIQKHAARRLHYDLRLEATGVLKSWAVPKGPSYNPDEKRLAVHVEDHPLEYADFEGLIAENQYGAGAVMVWDRGTWSPSGDWEQGLREGMLKFSLNGQKLKGHWKLIRIKERAGEEFEEASSRDNWLLIKADDEDAREYRDYDVTAEKPSSVKTGRSMEEIEKQKKAYWVGSREVSRRPEAPAPAKPPAPPSVRGTEAPWPDSFIPQLATLVSRLPEGDKWVSEIKLDGYRLIAWIKNGTVTLTTRRGQDWTGKFPSLARELSRLPVGNAILDGEVVVLNADGTADFQKLQNILKHREEAGLVYSVFDLPYYEGHDLGTVPLAERKNMLKELMTTYRERIPSVRYSEHLRGSGEQVLRTACRYAAEGIIAKRADSPYLQKRTKYWVKKKCINRQEFVIGGFTKPKGSRSLFGSLVLGYYDDTGRLTYCGNVGTGFNEETIRTVYGRLDRIRSNESPFASAVDDARNRDVQWVAPLLVAEIEFSEWTEGSHLRHPSFVALREDKTPGEIRREKESPPPEESKRQEKEDTSTPPVLKIPIKLSNPEKLLYPQAGITKKELAEYYIRVSEGMLPELVNRPLVLVRCPEGLQTGMRENCFFQKHLRDDIPAWIRSVPIEEKGEEGLYPVVDDLNGLLSLVQLGVLEIHMLGCRAAEVNHPDRMIFDLDPAPEVTKGMLIEAAFYIRDWLIQNNMRPFLKLTGGKGIHIVIPVNPVLTWEEIKKLSNGIAIELAQRKPKWFVTTVSKKKRTGKILIDYLRNSLGASSIIPYSTRAQVNAPVAIPVSEMDLTERLLANPVTVKNAAERLKELQHEPWKGMRTTREKP